MSVICIEDMHRASEQVLGLVRLGAPRKRSDLVCRDADIQVASGFRGASGA